MKSAREFLIDNIVRSVRDGGYSEVDDVRCKHLVDVMEAIKDNNIPGALVETGIYKGGTSIIMQHCNKQFKLNRQLWCFDSFKGCPDPSETKLGKHKNEAHGKGDFACDLETVKKNFTHFKLDVEEINFVEGWFEDTVPQHADKIGDIALLRFDGDLYSSTLDVLRNLYPKVVKGGYIIIDDYCLEACRQAVHQYINENNIQADINSPPGGFSDGSWWIKNE